MTNCRNTSKRLLTVRMPGIETPSRNEMNSAHWTVRRKVRLAWSIYLARSLCGLSGTVEFGKGITTTIISQGVARNCAIVSLPHLAEGAIQRKMVLPGSTSKGGAKRGSQ